MQVAANILSILLRVLIVPLWNWNEPTDPKPGKAQGFNRTFMELKYQNIVNKYAEDRVLIVPLWNWNK